MAEKIQNRKVKNVLKSSKLGCGYVFTRFVATNNIAHAACIIILILKLVSKKTVKSATFFLDFYIIAISKLYKNNIFKA